MTPASHDLAPGVTIGGAELPVIAGPCVIEGEQWTLEIAELLGSMGRRVGTPLVFKASFDKANRSSIDSARGPGLTEGLRVLRSVHEATGLSVLTDVHEVGQCGPVAEVCEILQIPAFLCRQTDLIVAAASTGRAVNIKKGQFMAPDDMRRAVDKARSTGNDRVTVTERGSSFGYHNLVVDMRGIPMMQAAGIPVIFDVTHSLQLPSADGNQTGGLREYAEPLARAAVAAGADGLYLEVHPDPDAALSDRTTQLPPERAEKLLASLVAVRRAVTTESDAAVMDETAI